MGQLPSGEVLACADRALDALAAAPGHGIVHRDIKPENLFLTYERTLKVLDFGIASVRELSAAGFEATRSGAALGTPAFMAPEQADGRGAPLDHRADLWALGATMFTLLTGRHVQNAGGEAGPPEALRVPSLLGLAPALDARLLELVHVAPRREPRARWEEARRMHPRLRRRSPKGPQALS